MEGKPEPCRVCGDKASGKHYGVASCDGCRGFFKRSIRRNLNYICKENGRCVVDVSRRNQCQACRFSKCLRVNMKRDAVQHERPPRPLAGQHSALRQLYSARSPPFAPAPAAPFPPYSYATLSDGVHGSFLENNLHDFTRFTESMATHAPDLRALNASSFNPFKIPLLTPLPYPAPHAGSHAAPHAASHAAPHAAPHAVSHAAPHAVSHAAPHAASHAVPHAGYLPQNVLYPPPLAPDHSLDVYSQKSISNNASSPSRQASSRPSSERADSPLSEVLNEDEVSSSGEACRIETCKEDGSKGSTSLRHEAASAERRGAAMQTYGRQTSKQSSVFKNDSTRRNSSGHLEHYGTKKSETSKDGVLLEKLETGLRRAEITKIDENVKLKIKLHTIFPELRDPAARVLLSVVGWVHGALRPLAAPERALLLCASWKELFIVQAAQREFYFGEEHVSAGVRSQDPSLPGELRRLTNVVTTIGRYRLDDTEYDCLKTALLFRTEGLDVPRPSLIEIYQEKTLVQLQRHCVGRGSCRFGKLLLLLPGVCTAAGRGWLERLLFPASSADEIDGILSRIFSFTTT